MSAGLVTSEYMTSDEFSQLKYLSLSHSLTHSLPHALSVP